MERKTIALNQLLEKLLHKSLNIMGAKYKSCPGITPFFIFSFEREAMEINFLISIFRIYL